VQVRGCSRRLVAFAGAVLAVASVGAATSLPAAANPAPRRAIATLGTVLSASVQVIVKLKPSAVQAEAATMSQAGVTSVTTIAPNTFLVDAHAPNATAAVQAFASRPGVAYAEPNQVYRADATVTPNDPCLRGCLPHGDQWYLTVDHAQLAWSVARGNPNVIVAVLDTRVSAHPDLAGKILYGPAYANNVCGPFEGDAVDHGTHVAGIVGAATNNGVGIAGLGWNTRVLSVGVLDARGCGTTASIVQGLTYATAKHVRIINMSLSGPPSNAIGDAVRNAQAGGALVIAAAGNDFGTSPVYPAAYPGVVSVAASMPNNHLADFSNHGSWVDIAAPGTSILSTTAKGGTPSYDELNGTSFSSPQVAAAAALLIARNPCMSNADVVNRLMSTARPLAGGGVRSGILDVSNAVFPPSLGYRIATGTGAVFTRGGTCFYGSVANIRLRRPIVGMTSTIPDHGYWLTATDGGVFAFGDARFHGSAATLPLVRPVVAMAATPSGNGYWLVASDGGVFSYGDAHFYGSTGGIALHQPVLGMAVTPSGHGYWLVASDGGIFAFGDAGFYGSTGGIRLVSPITGMTAAPSGHGYLLVGSDGGVFAFGAAHFFGSAAVPPYPSPTTSIASTNTGGGYYILHANGWVRAFGDATYYGSVATNGAVAINAARHG
jgi:hypothetical protein